MVQGTCRQRILDEEVPGSETPDRVIDAFEELVTLSDHETDELLGGFLVYFETTCIGIVQRTSTPISFRYPYMECTRLC
jgi:hypothetical protein